MKCNLCPRKCNVDRDKACGYCSMSNTLRVAVVKKHMDEEPCISGVNGSGTIFFSGCNLKCVYCQNNEISNKMLGVDISVDRLAEIFKELEDSGVHNINLVTPTHYVDKIKQALDLYKPNIPIVYNTSSYDSVESIAGLKGYVDIFLADYKYYDDNLAFKYSKAVDYRQIAESAIDEMLKISPKCMYDENGIMQKGVIVRHMVLPGCAKDSVRVLNRIKEKYGDSVQCSVMSQYVPCGDAMLYPEINRKLKPIEYKYVINACIKLGIDAYAQEMSSADKCYIPEFDGKGVLK